MTARPTLVHRAATTTGALFGLGTTAALLAFSGRTLPLPHTASPSGLVRWVSVTGPATATFTAARALAMVLVGWFAATWVLAVVVRLLRLPGAVRAADGFTFPFVRRLADLVAGAAIVAVSVVPVSQAGAITRDPSPLVVMRDLGPTATAPPAATPPPSTTSTTVTVAPDTPTPTTPDPDPAPSTTSGGSTHTGRAADAIGATGTTWSIEPGDTLWHVAEHTASERLGRPASGGEVLRQLDRLVALNADRLAIPGDADLVFPGQEFLIP
jgi:hypothetical protein